MLNYSIMNLIKFYVMKKTNRENEIKKVTSLCNLIMFHVKNGDMKTHICPY